MLSVGDQAPDFEVVGVEDGDHSRFGLSDALDADQNVLLTFYAFDFNPVCTTGMCALRDTSWFDLTDDLRIFAVSGDSVYSHERFAADIDVDFPLLCDTDRSVGDAYDVVFSEYEGHRDVHERSVYLIDTDGEIRFTVAVGDDLDDLDLDPLLDAVEAL